MSTPDLDQLRFSYKAAVDAWVNAIRAEEDLATPDHSMVTMGHWHTAHFAEEGLKADEAREAYKDGLRAVNCSI